MSLVILHRETLHLHSSEVEEDNGHGQVVEEEGTGRERRSILTPTVRFLVSEKLPTLSPNCQVTDER